MIGRGTSGQGMVYDPGIVCDGLLRCVPSCCTYKALAKFQGHGRIHRASDESECVHEPEYVRDVEDGAPPLAWHLGGAPRRVYFWDVLDVLEAVSEDIEGFLLRYLYGDHGELRAAALTAGLALLAAELLTLACYLLVARARRADESLCGCGFYLSLATLAVPRLSPLGMALPRTTMLEGPAPRPGMPLMSQCENS